MSDLPTGSLRDLNQNVGSLIINRLPGVNYKCQRIDLPGFTFAPVIQNFPNTELYVPGGKFQPDPVIISYIVDENMTNYFQALKWVVRLRQFEQEDIQEILEDFTVNLSNNHGKANASFRYGGGFLQSFQNLALDTRVAPEVLTHTLVLRYQSVEVDWYSGEGDDIVGLTI